MVKESKDLSRRDMVVFNARGGDWCLSSKLWEVAFTRRDRTRLPKKVWLVQTTKNQEHHDNASVPNVRNSTCTRDISDEFFFNGAENLNDRL